jgi:hypothetical protein
MERRGWLERSPAASPDAPLAVRAQLLSGIGHFAADQNDAETAVRRCGGSRRVCPCTMSWAIRGHRDVA